MSARCPVPTQFHRARADVVATVIREIAESSLALELSRELDDLLPRTPGGPRVVDALDSFLVFQPEPL